MSNDFDPYLIVKAPSGSQVDNDDYNGDRTRSHIEHVATESGAYSVIATSFQTGETGAYDATIEVGAGSGGGATPATGGASPKPGK